MNEQWNRAKKSASKRFKKRTKKTERDIQAKIGGQQKKKENEISAN